MPPVGELSKPALVTPRRVTREPNRAESIAPDWFDHVLSAPTPASRALALATSDSLVGQQLPASSRKRLIDLGARLGISRFETHLIIAAVQHRAPIVPQREDATRRSLESTLTESTVSRSDRLWLARAVAIVIFGEALLVAIALRVLVG